MYMLYVFLCIFSEKNVTSLNHRLVLVTKWTKITVVWRSFFLRNFCIANTKTHIPYTDLIVLISQILILYFLSNRFWFQYVIEFVRLFRIKGCMLTIKLSLYWKYIHVCTGTIDFGFYLTSLLWVIIIIVAVHDHR